MGGSRGEQEAIMAHERYPLNVIVYTEPGCAGCEQVKKFLHVRGIEFIEKDIVQDPTALRELRALGLEHLTVPVTRVGTEVIVGLNLGALEHRFGAAPTSPA
jgi:glutaredoxin-like protein NrdH